MSILYLIKSTPTLFPFNSIPISTTVFPFRFHMLCILNLLIPLGSAIMYMCKRPFTRAWATSQELYPWGEKLTLPFPAAISCQQYLS